VGPNSSITPQVGRDFLPLSPSHQVWTGSPRPTPCPSLPYAPNHPTRFATYNIITLRAVLARRCHCLLCSPNVSRSLQVVRQARVTDKHQMPRASSPSLRVVSPSLRMTQILALATPSIAGVNLLPLLVTSNAPRCPHHINPQAPCHIYPAFHSLPVRDRRMFHYSRASSKRMTRHSTSVTWLII
jgi:hypothetical protein